MKNANLQYIQKQTASFRLSSFLEMWLLTGVFIVVIAGLLQLQNLQISEQSEVAQELHHYTVPEYGDVTRANTPALGF